LINGHITDLARVVSHWAQEARSASNLGELGAEAAALAKTGKICTIVAPTNWHWEEANPPPMVSASPGRPKTAAEAIARAAAMLKNDKKTGLVLGNLALHGEALNIAGRIGAKTGAALLSEIFPSYHLSRGEGRPPVDPIPYEFEIGLKFLQPFEQLIFVGALFPVATFAYKNKPTMKSPPGCDLFVMASVEQDLTAALRSLAEDSGAADAAAPRQPRTEAVAPSGDLTAEAIGQSLCMLMPDNAILVDEAATNATPIFAATKGARAHDYLAPVNGGAIGGGLPLALGAAIACPDRKVVHLQADGSGMYTVQALWSMAREKTDIVIVVLKNDLYAILGLEMARVREKELNARMKSMLDLNNPTLDWVNISTGLGVPATRAGTAEEFHRQFEAALGAKGPHLIECQVAARKDLAALEDYIHKNR
jgi:acetolactate synthase-1/2/3 large subunit